jgi:hypothetical protein
VSGAVAVTLVDGTGRMMVGDPMLDASEGVLVIQFDDGTSRTYNWDYILEFTTLTDEEYAAWRASRGNDDDD